MASLFQSRYTYFPEEVVLTLPSKYIFSGKSIVLHFLLPFLYKIDFLFCRCVISLFHVNLRKTQRQIVQA